MKKLVLITLLLLSSFLTFAEEDHNLTNFKGGDIELKAYDHGVAGSVKEFIIFASQDEETGISTFIAKKDGKVINAEIKKQANGTFGSSFNYVTTEGETKNIAVTFKELNKVENKYIFTMNGKEVVIFVKADDLRNNHYINPQYDFQFDNKQLSVKMENGQACYNFSAHLIAILLTAYSL